MVLEYLPAPDDDPLVLDNLDADIKPASQRSDLRPVYSFNATGWWLETAGGGRTYMGSAARLSRWQELLRRMRSGGVDEKALLRVALTAGAS